MKPFISKLSILLLSFLLIVSVAIVPVFAAKSVKDQYPLDEESPLNGLSIGFYGDSICEGMVEMNTEYAAVRAWAGRIAAANGCTFDNYGRSGASVSNCRGANTIMTQLVNSKNAGKQYDIIVLHGGVNDAWDDVAVGEITEDYPPISSYDPSTFAPALEQVLTYTEENFPDATICYIINFKFLNASMGISLMDMDRYVDMTIAICEKWGIEYLDLYHNEELVEALHPYTTGPSGTKHYQNTYLYDFVHPSTKGFDLIYPYINEFLIDLVDPDYNDSKQPEPEPEPEPDPEPKPEPEPEPEPKPEPEPEPTTDPKESCSSVMGASALTMIVLAVPPTMAAVRKRKEN